MAFFDEFESNLATAGDTALATADQYLNNAAASAPALIAASDANGGNLTAAQIQAGLTGQPIPQAPPKATPAQLANARQASQIKAVVSSPYMLILAAAGFAYFIFHRSRRG